MKVLVACEESQEVCKAFRRLGHEAYSCDIQDCSGGHPEWHIQGDVSKIVNPSYLNFPVGFDNESGDMDGDFGFEFYTANGEYHYFFGKWDLIIAHPPCTYLSNAGACRLYPRKGHIDENRYLKGLDGKKFFMEFLNADCEHIAVENPVPSKVFELPEKTQVIQPYEFGHPFTKKTYLWLKGLPKLMPTEIVKPVGPYVCGNSQIWKKQAENGVVYGKEKSAKHRSKTFPGIAKAMAEQWGGVNDENKKG